MKNECWSERWNEFRVNVEVNVGANVGKCRLLTGAFVVLDKVSIIAFCAHNTIGAIHGALSTVLSTFCKENMHLKSSRVVQ